MEKATTTATDAVAEKAPVPRSKRVNQIIFLAAAAFLLNALLNQAMDSRNKKTLAPGAAMPSFSLSVMGGGEKSEKDFLGKPTLYFFYANWCPCSHESVGWVKKAYREHKAEGLAVLSVGIQDSSSNLESFAQRHNLEFPVSASGGDGLASDVGVTITPTTVLVDRDGIIRSVLVGKIEEYSQLSESLKSVLPGSANAA